MVRQVVRTASFTGPYLIGLISDQIAPNTGLGLRWAIVATCPLYAFGGLIMLLAARYYPRDIATVIAYSRRAGQQAAASAAADACGVEVAQVLSAEASNEQVVPGASAEASNGQVVTAVSVELCAELVVEDSAAGLGSAAPAAGMDSRAESAPAPGSDA